MKINKYLNKLNKFDSNKIKNISPKDKTQLAKETSFLHKNPTVNQRLKAMKLNITTHQVCKKCKNFVNYSPSADKMWRSDFCSIRCSKKGNSFSDNKKIWDDAKENLNSQPKWSIYSRKETINFIKEHLGKKSDKYNSKIFYTKDMIKYKDFLESIIFYSIHIVMDQKKSQWPQRLFVILKNIEKNPVCKCKINSKFLSIKLGYSKSCNKCADKDAWKNVRDELKVEKNDKDLYYYLVNFYTNKNLLNNLKNIEKRSRIDIREDAHHLDHKYSKIQGFRDCILPIYIGNINNLEMISHRANTTKHKKCSITQEELFEGFIKERD